MSDLDEGSLAPRVAGALAAAGWSADHPALREAAPVAVRGHNLVYLAPPSPAWAVPVLAGLFARRAAAPAGILLALAPAESVDEWARVAERTARSTGLRVSAADAPGRASRLLKGDSVDLLILTPDTAHELVRRSALKMDTVAGLLLLFPESWGGADPLPGLLADLPRETQRIVVTADRAGSEALIERYCWRAPVVDLLAMADTAEAPPVRTSTTGWRRRLEALTDLVQQLDPQPLAVWTADQGDRESIAQALAAVGTTATITSGVPGKCALIVAYDLPSPSLLRALAEAGDLLLLLTPGSEAYAGGLAPRRRPVPLGGQLAAAQAGLAGNRRRVAEVLEHGVQPGSFFAVAPLLERHEAAAVAAALYELWDSARRPEPAPQAAPSAAPAGKLWIGVGKRDEATPHDLVAALIKEGGVPREAVGKVEIRDTFALVEVAGGQDLDRIAERLTGKSIRKRRVVARRDRGRTPKTDR